MSKTLFVFFGILLFAACQLDSINLSAHAVESAAGAAHCATCHDLSSQKFAKASAPLLDIGADGDIHVRKNIACIDCHVSHNARLDEGAKPGVETCRKCHAQTVAYYETSAHFEAFSQLRMPQCSVCHLPHRTSIPPADYGRLPESGIGAKTNECLSCHFEGSPIAGLVVRIADGRTRLSSSAKRLDELAEKLEGAEKWLPAFLRSKSRPLKSGSDYISSARMEMHSGKDAVLRLAEECLSDIDEYSEFLSAARFRIFLLYGGGLLIWIVILALASKPGSRKKRNVNNGYRTRR